MVGLQQPAGASGNTTRLAEQQYRCECHPRRGRLFVHDEVGRCRVLLLIKVIRRKESDMNSYVKKGMGIALASMLFMGAPAAAKELKASLAQMPVYAESMD